MQPTPSITFAGQSRFKKLGQRLMIGLMTLSPLASTATLAAQSKPAPVSSPATSQETVMFRLAELDQSNRTLAEKIQFLPEATETSDSWEQTRSERRNGEARVDAAIEMDLVHDPNPDNRTYTVKAGDTLWDASEALVHSLKEGSTANEEMVKDQATVAKIVDILQASNNIKNPKKLAVGKSLDLREAMLALGVQAPVQPPVESTNPPVVPPNSSVDSNPKTDSQNNADATKNQQGPIRRFVQAAFIGVALLLIAALVVFRKAIQKALVRQSAPAAAPPQPPAPEAKAPETPPADTAPKS